MAFTVVDGKRKAFEKQVISKSSGIRPRCKAVISIAPIEYLKQAKDEGDRTGGSKRK